MQTSGGQRREKADARLRGIFNCHRPVKPGQAGDDNGEIILKFETELSAVIARSGSDDLSAEAPRAKAEAIHASTSREMDCFASRRPHGWCPARRARRGVAKLIAFHSHN
jgi:hypothetical protein